MSPVRVWKGLRFHSFHFYSSRLTIDGDGITPYTVQYSIMEDVEAMPARHHDE